MKIYLVRHGETDANKNHIMQGQLGNLQLNQTGIMQTTTLKNEIKDIKFDICFTSPLIRTWSTAMILVGDRVKIQEDERLIERYLGNFEGKNRKLYDADKYWDYKLNSNEENVEPIQDIFKRCEDFLKYLKENYKEDANILIVSHSAIVRCLHHLLLNIKISNKSLDFNIENCYYKVYNF